MFKVSKNNKGEVYVGEAVKIVIAIVLGAALLAGLVLVANKVILPKTQGWIETLFDSTNKYSGAIADGAYNYDTTNIVKGRMAEMLGNSFYDKYKDNPNSPVNNEIVEIYNSLLYGEEWYGVDRNKQKEAMDKDFAENPEDWDAKEMEFYQDWCNAFEEVDNQMNDPNLDAFASEAVHYVVKADRGEMAEEEAMDKIVASAEKHGYDGDAVRAALFE